MALPGDEALAEEIERMHVVGDDAFEIACGEQPVSLGREEGIEVKDLFRTESLCA